MATLRGVPVVRVSFKVDGDAVFVEVYGGRGARVLRIAYGHVAVAELAAGHVKLFDPDQNAELAFDESLVKLLKNAV